MQICGSQHPDHYKRSLAERDDGVANATAADAIGDLNACLSVYSKLLGGSANISLAMWEIYSLTEIAIMKQFDMNLNVTDQLDGWIAKFQNWDSNGDGVLTWDESMVVRPWSWP
jgi:hypothetical protein